MNSAEDDQGLNCSRASFITILLFPNHEEHEHASCQDRTIERHRERTEITKLTCSRRGYRLHQTNILPLQSKGGNEQTDGTTGEGEHLGAERKSSSRASGFGGGAGRRG